MLSDVILDLLIRSINGSSALPSNQFLANVGKGGLFSRVHAKTVYINAKSIIRVWSVLTDTYLSLFSDVWILGSSYIFWAEQRASRRGIVKDLGVKGVQSIKWVGRRGMRWHQLMHEFQYLTMHAPPPKVLVLHLGANDITTVRCSHLRNCMRGDILLMNETFPETKVVISAMIQRCNWASDIDLKKIENKRKTLNRFLRRLAAYIGGGFVPHEDLRADTLGFYFHDGIHLSDVGNDLFLMGIRDALEKYIQ